MTGLLSWLSLLTVALQTDPHLFFVRALFASFAARMFVLDEQ
jgi:hypothetical protein